MVIKCPACGKEMYYDNTSFPDVAVGGCGKNRGTSDFNQIGCGHIFGMSQDGTTHRLNATERDFIVKHQKSVKAFLSQVREYYWG